MNFELLFDSDDPAEWIVEGGKPARCLGEVSPKRRCAGLPSYELEDDFEPRGFQVFDTVVMQFPPIGPPKVLPRSYGMVSLVAPEGMVPLHHSPDAWWRYRPLLHDRVLEAWQTMGSQAELQWRYGLYRTLVHRDPETLTAAHDRADWLLRDNLSSWQLADYVIRDAFHVRGAATGNLYEITIGDGFRRVDPVTNTTLETFCLHPEAWLPAPDVALATKFALEDPALEREAISGANSTVRRSDPPKASPELHYAHDMALEVAV